MKRIAALALLSFLATPTAWAQTTAAPVVEGSAFSAPPTSLAPSTVASESGELPMATNPAQMEVRITGIEDELRAMRGKNEELEFQIRKLNETMEKLQRDVEMRLGDIEGGKKPAGEAAEHTPAKPAAETEKPSASAETPAQTTAGDGVLRLPDGSETTPKDLYNQAFRLLNQTKYDEAAKMFAVFTKQYPKDPLVGNAYYWAGETYYIRRDYVTAADNFRAGFEALPTGPKAPDNLLKLAMSLDALSREKEACVVLQQVVSKFKKDATSVVEKATQEQKRIGCK